MTKEEKTGFIYLWYDKKHKRFYIGCHVGKEDDGYICSSKWMRDAYRYRKHDFRRRILKRNIPRDQLLAEEHKWLDQIKDDELGKKYYNICKHHFGHWANDVTTKTSAVEKRKKTLKTSDAWKKYCESKRGKPVSEETKAKLREYAILQFSDPENRRKAGKANKGNSRRKGKTHTETTKNKMRERMLGNIPWNKGKTGVHKHSEETKQKMSNSHKKRFKEII